MPRHGLRIDRRIRRLLLPLLVFTQHASALQVTLNWLQDDYCYQGVGILQALASGGSEPYHYTWSRDLGTGYEVLCIDCGDIRNMLAGNANYKVVVTDNTGAMAEHIGYLPTADLTIQPQDMVIFPYVPGTQPYLKLYVNNFVSPPPGATISVPNAELLLEPELPGNGIGIWWFRLLGSPGSTTTLDVTFHFEGGSCTVNPTLTVPQPTVLPTMAVIDGQGSCANAPTGSVTVALYDGSIPQPLRVILNGNTNWSPAIWTDQTVNSSTTFVTLENLDAGDYTFHLSGNNSISSTPTDMGFPYQCFDSIPFTIPDLGATCGRAEGRVFVDNNMNCTWQNGEPGMMGVVLEVQPGPVYATASPGGTYDVVLPPGDYTMELQSSLIEEHCVNTPIPFTITGAPGPITVDHASVSLVPMDVVALLSSGAARPGFEYHVGLTVRNNTPAASGAITISLDYDPLLGFIGAASVPTMSTSGNLSWTLPQLTAFQQHQILVRFQVPPDVGLLGTDLITSAVVGTANTDAVPANNTTTLVRTVTGSYDPNDKLAATSLGSNNTWLIGEDQWVDYTIRFQNTGSDTAFHVIITDTLPSTLDPMSLELGAASHPFSSELRDAGTLKFRFLNILLPDSNTNEPLSHGFVSFRIRPNLPVTAGTSIANTANIFFDFNEPVITEPSVLMAEFSTGLDEKPSAVMHVAPNPAYDVLRVTVPNATGSDIQVFSADGRSIAMPVARQGNSIELDVRSLAAGPYLIRTGQGTARFVKQ